MNGDGRGFGGRLRGLRKSAGLSQEELAERSGLNVRTISNLERGFSRWPYRDTLRRLADALLLSGVVRAEFMAASGRRVVSEGSAPAEPPPWPAPRLLPSAMRYFTGRKAELGFLTGLLAEAQSPAGSGAVVISAIVGAAGVGKTALAVHWAHQHAECFPDGQLYADLHGFDATSPPAPTTAAVCRFLEALGVPPARMPADAAAQLDLYRSLLAGKRVLIILDNVRDARQVRPLTPGEGGCMVLVTSRSQLTELIALDGASALPVGPLTMGEARELLTRRLGADRISSEQSQADELISRCGRLPLALNMAAARAISLPALPLSTLAAGLKLFQSEYRQVYLFQVPLPALGST